MLPIHKYTKGKETYIKSGVSKVSKTIYDFVNIHSHNVHV